MKHSRRSDLRRACVLLVFLALLGPSCASEKPQYVEQIYDFILDLSNLRPTSTEEIFDFAVRHSHQLNLGIPGINAEIVEMLEKPGPWFEKILLAYLLALKEDEEGFAVMIKLLDGDLPPEVRDGLHYCGLKYLGMTEREEPVPVTGWEVDLDEWKEYRSRIRSIGLRGWRREFIQNIVLSQEPRSGNDALDAAAWLSYCLEAGDVPFLGDLLEQGSPKCDVALLTIIENILMRQFMPDVGEGALDEGREAFWTWFEANRSLPPDKWITDAFVDSGYEELEDLYNQRSLTKILPCLMDESQRWVLVRGHSLTALNRICGYNVDRMVIFLEEPHRKVVAGAFKEWYLELAQKMAAY